MNEQELERLVVRLTGDATSYQRMLVQASQSTQQAGRVMQTEAGKAEAFGKVIDNLGSRMSLFAGQMRALAALESPMSILTSGVQGAARAESLAGSFKTLTGSVEVANRTLKDLRKFAAETPFEMPEVVAASKQMIAFGESAENIVPTMRMLGDVSSGLQIPLGELIRVYGTLKSQGRAFTVDINQFAMRGIPIWKELEKQFGKSNAEVRKMVEEGRVGFPEVEKAFKSMTGPGGQFFNMMKEQSGLTEGLFSTMSDEINEAKRAIGEAVIEHLRLKDAMKAVTEGAQAFSEWFRNLSNFTKTLIAALAILILSLGSLVVAWKVGSLAVGGAIATFGHMAETLQLVTSSTVGWIASVRGIPAATIPATASVVGLSSAVAFTTTTFHANTAAVTTNAAAMQTSAAASGRASAATLGMRASSAAATAGVVALVAALATLAAWHMTGGAASLDQFNQNLARGDELAAKARESFKKFGAEDQDALRKNIEGMKARLEGERKRAQGFGISSFFSAETVRAVADLPLYGAGVKADMREAANSANNLEEAIKAAEAQMASFSKTASGEVIPTELKESLDKMRDSLLQQIETFGMTEDQVKLYELGLRAAGKAASEVSQIAELTDRLAELKKEAKEAEEAFKEIDKLMDEGAQLEERLNPMTAYTNQVAKLNDMLYLGAISQKTFDLAMAEANKKLQEATRGAKDTQSALSDLEAVLSGSGRSRAAMARHLGGINVMNRFVPQGASSQKSETLLDQISKNTKGILDNAVTIIEANF